MSTQAQLDPEDLDIDPYLDDCVGLDVTAVSAEFARLPSHYARWNEVHARLTGAYLKAQAAVRRVRSRRRTSIQHAERVAAKAAGNKPPTVDDIDSALDVDNDVINAEDNLIIIDQERTRVRGILTALGRKSEALVTIGANQRAEIDTPDHMNDTPTEPRRHSHTGEGTSSES